jgi:hypothetical protein
MREYHFDELCGLRQIAFSWAMYTTCCDTINCDFYPHSVFRCFAKYLKKAATIFLYIKQLIFIIEMDYVFCEVGSHVLCEIEINFSLRLNNKERRIW